MSNQTTVTQVTRIIPLADEAATRQLGAALATVLQAGMVVRMEGDLGAGKTTLVRALLRELGVTGAVKSPTYALVESYAPQGWPCHHFDFYRFESEEEFPEAGLDEYFQGDALCLVEWPDRAGRFLPPADVAVRLQPAQAGGACGRIAELCGLGERGVKCLNAMIWPS